MAEMDHAFVDTDVMIDVLVNRQPFAQAAAGLFSHAEKKRVCLAASSLSFSNVYHIIRKTVGHETALQLLTQLGQLFDILPVDGVMVRQAFAAGFKDFEDSIQYFCAKSDPRIHAIITRNVKDYAKSELAVHTPESYLKML